MLQRTLCLSTVQGISLRRDLTDRSRHLQVASRTISQLSVNPLKRCQSKAQTKFSTSRGILGWLQCAVRCSFRLAILLVAKVLLKPAHWNGVQSCLGAAVLGHRLPGVGLVTGFGVPLGFMKAYGILARELFPAHYRSLRFWSLVGPIYVRYKLTQHKVRHMSEEQKAKEWAKRHEWGALKVYKLCTKLRGFYLKQGQELGSRSDFIPSAWCEILEALQDRVPPVPFEEIEQTLRQSFRVNRASQIFASIGTTPLASATIAQVHIGEMEDGSVVVLKAQYKNQRELCRLDLLNMKRLATFLQNHDMSFFDMKSVVAEFEAQVPLEFDFQREAAMMTRVRQNLAHAGLVPQEIVVPRVISGLVSPQAIVMTFLDGFRIDNDLLLHRWRINRRSVALSIGKAYGQMILVDGLVNTDPHPGNLLCLKDGRIAIIDFGQAKQVPAKLRKKLCTFYLALCSGNKYRIMHTFRELGIELDTDAVDETTINLIPTYATGMLDTAPLPDEVEINPFSEGSPLKKLPIKKFNPQLFMILRTMGLLRSLCVTLNVNISMAQVFKPYAYKGLKLSTADAAPETYTFEPIRPIDPFTAKDERDS